MIVVHYHSGSNVHVDFTLEADEDQRANLPSLPVGGLVQGVRSHVEYLRGGNDLDTEGNGEGVESVVITVFAENEVRGGVILSAMPTVVDRALVENAARSVENLLAATLISRVSELAVEPLAPVLESVHPMLVYSAETRVVVFCNASAQSALSIRVGSIVPKMLVPANLSPRAPVGTVVTHWLSRGKGERFHASSRVIDWLGCRMVVGSLYRGNRKTLELRRELSKQSLVSGDGADGFWEWNATNDRAYFSSSWAWMLGHEPQEIEPTVEGWLRLVHPEDHDRLRETLTSIAESEQSEFVCEYRIQHRDGRVLWMNVRGVARDDESAGARIVAGAQTDITQRRMSEQRLWVAQHYDALTDLPNRTLLIDRVGRCLVKQRREPESRFALIYLDVDRFKTINDTFGHRCGDRLLAVVARRLETCVRECDTLARMGGDEFALLLVDIGRTADVIVVAERIARALAEPVDVADQRLQIQASLGIAFSDGSYHSPDEVLRDADIAMYRAKAEGRARFVIFDASMHASFVADASLEVVIGQAIEQNAFRLSYQPIVDLRRGRIVALEAQLNRVASGRVDSYADCLAAAGAANLSVTFGSYLLRRALRNFGTWRAKWSRLRGMKLAIHLSTQQLVSPELFEMVTLLAKEVRVPLNQLVFELHEGLLPISLTAVVGALSELRRMGIELQIGGVGSVSALPMLHRVAASGDILEIDKAFVQAIDDGGELAARAMIELGHGLGLATAACGVTTQSQMECLTRLNCDRLRGPLICPAVSCDELETLIGKQ